MSFNYGDLSAADVAAVMGNNNGIGNGENSLYWLFILFLFMIMGGWNGNGNGNFGGNNQAYPAWQQSFDQAALTNQLAGISNGLVDMSSNLTNQLNTIAMAIQNACCENRTAIADLKFAVATEACNIRQASTANTQLILNAINTGFQGVYDKMCQQEIDALKTQNANLQTQINLSALRASQSEQTSQILADNARQTVALEQYLNPTPKPAYMVQNPNCCQGNFACAGAGF